MIVKVIFGKSQSNNRRWRVHRGPGSLVFWLYPLFLGLYWRTS